MRNLLIEEDLNWKSIADDSPAIPRKGLEAPSEEFLSAIHAGVGSLVAACDFCGRVFFGTGGDYDEGEEERYEELAKENPDKYVRVEGFTSLYRIGGKEYADGCPCNAPRQYEDFIWAHRHEISEYVVARSAAEFRDAQAEMDRADEMKKALSKG